MASKTKGTQTSAGLANKPKWLTDFQSGMAKNLDAQRANNETMMTAQGFTNKQDLGGGMTQYTKPNSSSAVGSSFGRMMGSDAPSLKSLDDQFMYQGVKYGDLPSYKAGSGGGKSLDRLAAMMGGQIYNPYQFSRMKSAGSSSGEYPYKSALAGQETSTAMAKQELAGKQSLQEARFRAETEKQMQAASMGYASAAEMEADLRRKKIMGLLST
jgi:hypothetical protein